LFKAKHAPTTKRGNGTDKSPQVSDDDRKRFGLKLPRLDLKGAPVAALTTTMRTR
jgi:hypothetical protein